MYSYEFAEITYNESNLNNLTLNFFNFYVNRLLIIKHKIFFPLHRHSFSHLHERKYIQVAFPKIAHICF